MRLILSFALLLTIWSCTVNNGEQEKRTNSQQQEAIAQLIDQWHKDAAKADTAYFSSMASNAIYIGTDKTEHWTKDEFIEFATPYFEKGRAWNFKPMERNIFLSKSGEIAWFDELLTTWMGTCRASGVVICKKGKWKISHYHLSLAVPNEKMREAIDLIGEKPQDGEQYD